MCFQTDKNDHISYHKGVYFGLKFKPLCICQASLSLYGDAKISHTTCDCVLCAPICEVLRLGAMASICSWLFVLAGADPGFDQGGGPDRDRPKTAILGPQFCRILVLGPHFWWSGGARAPPWIRP